MSVYAEDLLASRPPALRDVPSFPPVAARLMRLVSDENDNVDFREIADVVRADAAFSAEVLRLANSPLFSSRREIKNVPHALAVLGLSQLRAIVATLAVREFLLTGRQSEAVRMCWRHTLATAMVCETIGSALWVDKGLAYTAGLLHDIGLLALMASDSGAHAELVLNTPGNDIDDFLARERETSGINHCDAGHWLLSEWGMPPEFAEVAANHHAEPDAYTWDISLVVHLGCQAASMADFPTCNLASEWDPERIAEWLPERNRPAHLAKLRKLPMTIAANVNYFECDFLQAR